MSEKVENLNKKIKKESKSNEGLIIGIIVAAVILIALAIFGYFLYNKMFKAVAKFEGGTVNSSDYEIYYRTFAPMLQYYGLDTAGIGEIVAEKAASDKILVKAAEKAGIKISDEDKAYVDEIFSDAEQLQTFVDAGIDPTRMKQFYYNDYIMDDYLQHLMDSYTAEEVKEYIVGTYGETADMKEYTTNHILFSIVDTTTGEAFDDAKKAEVKAEAEAVLTRALNGEDFSALAKEFSDDTATAVNGGEYKVYLDDNTVEQFTNAVVALEVGKINPTLVETVYGYHIIKLAAFDENGRVNSQTERKAMAQAAEDLMIQNAKIEINTEVMNATIKSVTGADVSTSETEEEHDHDHSTDTVVEGTDTTTENSGETVVVE